MRTGRVFAFVLTFCAAVIARGGVLSADDGITPYAEPAVTEPDAAEPEGGGLTESGDLTAEEFLALLSLNEGGEVTLTGDVLWSEPSGYISVSLPTTVLMGDFCISSPYRMSVSGPVRFVGNGAQNPLFYTGEYLALDGGVEIEALSDGATAVYTEGDMDAAYSRVTANGTGSAAIRAAGAVNLLMCEVSAGETAIISSGDIAIDASRVSPMPPSAKITEREAVPGGRIQQNGISLVVGESLDDALSGFPSMQYYLLDVDRYEPIVNVDFGRVLENLPVSTDAAGEYIILCRPDGVPGWFPIELEGYEIPLHVIAENQPHIQRAMRFYDTVMLQFFSDIGDDNEMTLWYSSDDGQTWNDFMELDTAAVWASGAMVDYLPPNRVYMFQLEVKNGAMAGFSNPLSFTYYDSDTERENSGDRTGADRFPTDGNETGETETPASDNEPDAEPETEQESSNDGPAYDEKTPSEAEPETENLNETAETIEPSEAAGVVFESTVEETPEPAAEPEIPIPADTPAIEETNTAPDDTYTAADENPAHAPPIPVFAHGSGSSEGDITSQSNTGSQYDNTPEAVVLPKPQETPDPPALPEREEAAEPPVSRENAEAASPSIPEREVYVKAQPSLPLFSPATAMAVTGAAAAILTGLCLWIKIRLRGVK